MLTQYCPIEVAAEIVAERWNLLIIRDLMGPGRGFNDLHRCLPRMSRSMLAERLRRLERAGIVTRTSHGSGRIVEYRLTGPRSIATEFPGWFDAATPWHDTIARLADQSDSVTGSDTGTAPTVGA